MASRILKLRRPDVCVLCGTSIEAGREAWWDADAKTVTCHACHRRATEPPDLVEAELQRGHAGASARREHERRKTNREASVRDAHRRIGGLLLWLQEAPQHETAFRRGELGEVAVGESLERRTAEGPAIILHDRRMPLARGNIDHIAIAPAGVFVIDAKAHSGKVQIDSPLFGSTTLRIAGRDRTELIDGLDRQVVAVRDALDRSGHGDVPIQGVLCFTNADLPLLRTLRMRGHLLLYRKAPRRGSTRTANSMPMRSTQSPAGLRTSFRLPDNRAASVATWKDDGNGRVRAVSPQNSSTSPADERQRLERICAALLETFEAHAETRDTDLCAFRLDNQRGVVVDDCDECSELWTARRLAAHYAVGVRFIYGHAEELGAIRLGNGPSPRLRFDPAVVRQRWASVNAPPPAARTRRRRPTSRLRVVPAGELLEFDRDD